MARLGERLHFHPLAVEDVFNVPQRPKVEAYPDHYLIILRMLRLAPGIDEEQVSIFFGASYVVTVQERPGGDVFEGVRRRIRTGRGRLRTRRRGLPRLRAHRLGRGRLLPGPREPGRATGRARGRVHHARERHPRRAHPGPSPRPADRAPGRLAHAGGAGRDPAGRVEAGDAGDAGLPPGLLRPRRRGHRHHRDRPGDRVVGDGDLPRHAEPAAERGDEGPHRDRHAVHPAHVHRQHLRHEFRGHAGAQVAMGVPGRARPHGPVAGSLIYYFKRRHWW